MLTRLLTAGALAATVLAAAPVVAQSTTEQRRFDEAQARFDREYDLYRQEVDRYRATRTGASYRGGGYGTPVPVTPVTPAYSGYSANGGYPASSGYDDRGGYRTAPDAYAADDRYDPNYEPSRYYRVGSNYQERTLGADERVYAGTDGRYYCRRSDGTTGLIVGGAAGGVLGNVIDGGHSRTVGTLLGAAAGALAGRAVERSQQEVRCR